MNNEPKWMHPEPIGVRPDWLAKTQEEPLKPNQLIVDAHHHFWHRRDCYMIDEFANDAKKLAVQASVVVQAGQMYRDGVSEEIAPLGETEFLNGQAAMAASIRYDMPAFGAAIIGYADLTLGDIVAPLLEAHLSRAPDRFRGVRNLNQWDPSPDIINGPSNKPKIMQSTGFRKGFSHLARLGLLYEAWIYFPQLPELCALADAFPNTTIVADHFGGPLGVGPYAHTQNEMFNTWKMNITELSKRPNVYLKLGGLGMPNSRFGYPDRAAPPSSKDVAKDWQPFFDVAMNTFGPSRCMAESNFPVDKLSMSYTVLWNAFIRMSKSYSTDEQDAVFRETATIVYGL
ncbi:MAG: amidohydrolase family protein [Alphaproteobacteria bacterium]|nr:amidohydrolase family protein [Alphaproteobacteria bacterium]